MVDIDTKATVLTDGLDSDGIVAQSIGGGGGNSGVVRSKAIANIGTLGEGSTGLLAQSIGGGGGNGGFSVRAALAAGAARLRAGSMAGCILRATGRRVWCTRASAAAAAMGASM